ncbi:DUF2071 domain-containing protein [Kitasatospora purpeofusca]|uniref:DUF2071 domain-containing protein n=1 Tax=Kitasatospora purpeofusca TaxID=67352 RepID=UPI00069021C9|nr:DUF2071 domain-containing protein [Kitasatospora purpeofusca]
MIIESVTVDPARPVRPAAVSPLRQPGVVPDIFNATGWIGPVAFAMERLGSGISAAIRCPGSFPEVTVRLYSVDGQGRRGAVRRPLDCPRPAAVLTARALFALPHRWSETSLTAGEGTCSLATRARRPGRADAICVLTAHTGEHLEPPGPPADYLTDRRGLHTRVRGRTAGPPTDHPRRPLHEARLTGLSQGLTAAADVDVDGPPTSVLCSTGAPVRFGARTTVTGPGRGPGPGTAPTGPQ